MAQFKHHLEEFRATEQAPCPYCSKLFLVTELPEHCERCEITSSQVSVPSRAPRPSERFPIYRSPERLVSELAKTAPNRLKCLSCLQDICPRDFHAHIKECSYMALGDINRLRKFVSNLGHIDWSSAGLTREQWAAIDHVVRTSKVFSDEASDNLSQRIIKLGFTEQDLERTLKWVRSSAPIIIHVHLDKLLPLLMNETHYRNQFETGTSYGSRDLAVRTRWEDNIFNNSYRTAKAADRVKYAVLNVLDDVNGVHSCKVFGDSYFALRLVRLRTSFASINVSPQRAKLATCDHYAHVLNEYNDVELTAVLEVATKKKPWAGSRELRSYKEVQIHGPIILSEHIEYVAISERHKMDGGLLEMADRFVAKNKCRMSRMW